MLNSHATQTNAKYTFIYNIYFPKKKLCFQLIALQFDFDVPLGNGGQIKEDVSSTAFEQLHKVI